MMDILYNAGASSALSALNASSNVLSGATQELSTGKRINSAADDASGYAISQKMQAQINGLNQAGQNAQDGISMIQTASSALNQTSSILQTMNQLATEASNSTTTSADRQDLQAQFNQLADQINNIGNTTQYNTQNLLQGNGQSNLTNTGDVASANFTNGAAASYTQASQTVTLSAAAVAGDTASFDLNGQTLTTTFATAGTSGNANDVGYNVTSNSAAVNIDSTPTLATTAQGLSSALNQMISANSTLAGQYTASYNAAAGTVTVSAVAGGQFQGAAGNIGAFAKTGTIAGAGVTTAGATTNPIQASTTLNGFEAVTTATETSALVGTGFSVNGQQIQFYNANNGPYTGTGIGVNLSNAIASPGATSVANAIVSQVGNQLNGVTLSASGAGALTLTATQGGTAGNSMSVSDGGMQQDFQATFQIGANTGQTMTLNIANMGAQALGITGTAGTAGFSATNNVNNGTTNQNTEAALDITSTSNADAAIQTIQNAISQVTTQAANLGAVQNRLQSTMNNLSSTSSNLTSAQASITDVDMASEMGTYTAASVQQQAGVSMLAQAQQQPQLILKLLG